MYLNPKLNPSSTLPVGKHAVGVCDDGAGARGGDDEGAGAERETEQSFHSVLGPALSTRYSRFAEISRRNE